jgi:hypothetical protein
MTPKQLAGLWINGHIRELLEQQSQISAAGNGKLSGNGNGTAETGHQANDDDPTAQALRDALKHAELAAEASRAALNSYIKSSGPGRTVTAYDEGRLNQNGKNSSEIDIGLRSDSAKSHNGVVTGLASRGPTSRELSGEMGGDTAA